MKHRVYGKHLGRNKNQRTALFKNLVQSLIWFEKIETTEAKAKAIKGLVDKLITQAKSPTTRRLLAQFLVNKKTQDKLINDIVPRTKNRSSGFTAITKIGKRLGDGAMVVQMRLLTEGETKTAVTKKEDKAVKTEEKKTDEKQETSSSKAEVKVKERNPKAKTTAKKESK